MVGGAVSGDWLLTCVDIRGEVVMIEGMSVEIEVASTITDR